MVHHLFTVLFRVRFILVVVCDVTCRFSGIILIGITFLKDIRSRQVWMFTSKFETFVSNAYRLAPNKQGRDVNKLIVNSTIKGYTALWPG